MAQNRKIEWTDHTFNPWIGCTKVSDGCKHCYAEMLMDKRYGRAKWGPNGTRVRTSEANWRKPLAWNRQAEREGRRYRVFCASLADVFEDREELVDWRDELFAMIATTPHLDWLVLTKRPELAAEYLTQPLLKLRWMDNAGSDRQWHDLDGAEWPAGYLPNLWLGTSVENQQAADERIPHLLRCPAAVRFLSCEPLLGPVDIGRYIGLSGIATDDPHGRCANCGIEGRHAKERRYDEFYDGEWACSERCETQHNSLGCPLEHKPIDWVIVGGESGPGARPMHPDWARSIRDQCSVAGVPFFFKQWGEYGSSAVNPVTGDPVFRYFHSVSQWINKAQTWMSPGDVCVDMQGRICQHGADFQDAPYPVAVLRRVGKKASGRQLDGRTWDEFPAVPA